MLNMINIRVKQIILFSSNNTLICLSHHWFIWAKLRNFLHLYKEHTKDHETLISTHMMLVIEANQIKTIEMG